jgi:hypothetical protein
MKEAVKRCSEVNSKITSQLADNQNSLQVGILVKSLVSEWSIPSTSIAYLNTAIEKNGGVTLSPPFIAAFRSAFYQPFRSVIFQAEISSLFCRI